MRYLIKFFVKNEIFYSKSENSLDIKKFKDFYTFEITIIISLVLINCYKEGTWDNRNSTIIKMSIVNIYNNTTNQINIFDKRLNINSTSISNSASGMYISISSYYIVTFVKLCNTKMIIHYLNLTFL